MIEALSSLNALLGSPAELKALGVLRQRLWQRDLEASIERTLQSVPEDAGPLNSHYLLIRALSEMGDASPAYLRRWVGYLNTLAWLDEQV